MRCCTQRNMKNKKTVFSCAVTSKRKLLAHLEFCGGYDEKWNFFWIWNFAVSLMENRKFLQTRLVQLGWNSIKAVACYSEKFFIRSRSQQQQQFASCSYQHTQPLVKLLTNTCLRLDFTVQQITKLKNVSPLHKALYNYKKNQETPYDPSKLAIHSILRPEVEPMRKCGDNSNMIVSFDGMVRSIDGENILTFVDFDCVFTLWPEAPTKLKRVNQDWKTVGRSCGNQGESQAVINNTDFLMKIIPLTSFCAPTIYGTWIDQLICHPTKLLMSSRSLWLCNILGNPLFYLKQPYVWYSLPHSRWTVKGRGCASVLHPPSWLHTGKTCERNSCDCWWFKSVVEAQVIGWSSTVCNELYLL